MIYAVLLLWSWDYPAATLRHEFFIISQGSFDLFSNVRTGWLQLLVHRLHGWYILQHDVQGPLCLLIHFLLSHDFSKISRWTPFLKERQSRGAICRGTFVQKLVRIHPADMETLWYAFITDPLFSFSWTYYKLSNVGREASGPAFLGQIILYTSYCKGTRCIDNLLCCPFLAQIKWISESWMIYLAVYCRDMKKSLHCCIPEMSHCQVLEGWVLYFFAIPLKIYYLFWAPEGPIERQSFDGFVLFDRVNRGKMLLLRFNVLESHGFTLFQPATPCATFFRCFATPAWWLWHHGQMHVYLLRIQATISWSHARPRGGSLSIEMKFPCTSSQSHCESLILRCSSCIAYSIYIYI